MTHIAEIALFTADVPKLTAFYERLIGHPPRSRSESHAFFEVGGTTIFIHLATDDDDFEGAPNGDHIAFAVASQDRLSDELRSHGNDVVGPKDFYWGRSAYVHDPDGRIVELTQE
jgi:catechol-2,3-dioxygenase